MKNNCGGWLTITILTLCVVSPNAADAQGYDCGPASTIYFQDDGESGLNGWTHSAAAGPDTWALESSDANSPVNSWRALDVAVISDQRLVSPPVAIHADALRPMLEYYTKRDIEEDGENSCWDGAILEFSTNSGVSWSVFPNSRLFTDPYTGPVNAFGNPLGGLPAWCGASDWIKSQVDLSDYEGQTLLFRFRLGTDSSVEADDWHIDDVRVLDCDTNNTLPLQRTHSLVDGPSESLWWETSIVIGADFNPTVAFADAEQGSIRVLKCNDPACSGGDDSYIILDRSVGSYARISMAIGTDGMPVIAYVSSGMLKVAKCNDLACSGGDDIITLVDGWLSPVGSDVSIAVPSDGLPVVAYADQTLRNLKIIKCNDPACANADELPTTVDNSVNSVAAYVAVAVDADNLPVISYSDQTAGAMRVAKCNDPACTGGDEDITTVVDPSFQPYETAIAIGSDGLPIVTYGDNSGTVGGVHIFKCDDPACESGGEIFSNHDTGDTTISRRSSIAIGNDGFPIIAYEATEAVKVLKCNDLACTGPGESIRVVDSDSGFNGSGVDLALGGDGLAVISYGDFTSLGIKVAKCGETLCFPTISLAVPGRIWVGRYSDIALGADGFPVISYTGDGDVRTGALKVALCNDMACRGGDELLRVLDDSAEAFYTSIALGLDGYPIVSYYDRSDRTLKVAKCNDPYCFPPAVSISVVDGQSNDVGEWSSIAINGDGLPVISYYDANAGALKFASCNDAACSGNNETLTFVDGILGDPPNDVGVFSAMALGSDNLPLIVYLDVTLGVLKLAKCNDAKCIGLDESISVPSQPVGDFLEYFSIAISDDGFPIIGIRGEQGGLYVIKCNDAFCAGDDESVSNVDNYSDGFGIFTGLYSSITIGDDGLPVISYVGPLGLTLATCNDAACSGSDESIVILDTPANYSVGEVGVADLPSTAVIIGTDGLPIISYYDVRTGSLKVVHCETLDCVKAEAGTLLSLEKFVINDDGGIATASDFLLSASGPVVIEGPSGSASVSNQVVPPGAYVLSENGPAGYNASAWECDGGQLVGDTVTLAEGDVVTCSIDNNDIAASLIIVKRIINNNGGTATVGSFGINTSAGALSFGAGVADGADTLKYTANPLNVSANIAYSLAESNLAGYAEGSWTCVGGDNLGGGSFGSGTVTLAPGVTKTCTITNDDAVIIRSFTVYKNFIPDSTANVSVTATCSSGTVTNNPQPASEAVPAVFQISGASPDATCTATEGAAPAGYSKNESDCQDGDPLGSSCTLVNSEVTTQLTIVKRLNINREAPPSFAFTSSTLGGFSLAPDASKTFQVVPGSYRVEETPYPSGWRLANLLCEPSVVDNPLLFNGGIFTLSAGVHATCTFTNGLSVNSVFGISGTAAERSFGSAGSDNGEFQQPGGAAFDADGNIVIADTDNNRIQICDPSGVCTTLDGTAALQSPATPLAEAGFLAPEDVAVDSQGRVIVADTGNHRIQVCSAGVCNPIGGLGSGPGQFDTPRGVAVDGQDRIWVADTGNDRLQRCDDQGTCLVLGSAGSGLGQFAAPVGVAVGPDDRIWVADTGNHRIQGCSSDGQCTAFGELGTLLGQFDTPTRLAIDLDERIVVADSGNGRVQLCDPTGACVAVEGAYLTPLGVALNNDGELVVVDADQNQAELLCLVSPQAVFGSTGSELGAFQSPLGVVQDSQGRIIVADSDNDRIQLCDDSGACSAFGSSGSGLGQFAGPSAVALDSSARIVVADTGNDRIQLCTDSGSCTALGDSGTSMGQFNAPRGLAIDSADRIIVADSGNDRIQVCSDVGICTAFGDPGSGLGEFQTPWGVAIDSAGQIVVADSGNHRIQRCSDVGSCTAFGQLGAAPGEFQQPRGVAVDEQDRILVSDTLNSRLQRCDAFGTCSAFAEPGSAPGQVAAPAGVATAPNRRLLVADTQNHRVQVLKRCARPTLPVAEIVIYSDGFESSD